jgi:hypothetical protein
LFAWRQRVGGGAKLSFDGLDLAALPQATRRSHRFDAEAQVLKLLTKLGNHWILVWHITFLVTAHVVARGINGLSLAVPRPEDVACNFRDVRRTRSSTKAKKKEPGEEGTANRLV